MQPKYGLAILWDQNCGVQRLIGSDTQTDNLDTKTDRQIDRQTDQKVKTERPKIMYINMRYLPSAIIGGPIRDSISIASLH